MNTKTRTASFVPTALLALAAIAIVAAFATPSRADASTSEYCPNANLAGFASCYGGARTLYAVLGWGDQHAVCVGALQGGGSACSNGPGEGAYSPTTTAYTTPWIQNRAAGSNLVHGVAYQP
jgi:hypothetical protein